MSSDAIFQMGDTHWKVSKKSSLLLDEFKVGDVMQSLNDLYRWEEFSRDSLNVKRIYIDIAEDLIAGILLSQIVYWHLPSKNGGTKLRVKKEGCLWLAKGRNDWWNEIRITPKQFDRAIKILQNEGIVETKLFKFDGSPTVHIRLIEDVLIGKVKSIFTFGEKGNLPLGEMEFNKKEKSLTEITAKITSDKEKEEGNPFRFYEENGFGTLSPFISEQIGYWMDELNEYVIVEALKESLNNNVRKWSYTDKILKNWSQMNLTTLQQVRAYMEEQRVKKDKPKQVVKKIVPDIDPFLLKMQRLEEEAKANGGLE